jgi:hypothetical protein
MDGKGSVCQMSSVNHVANQRVSLVRLKMDKADKRFEVWDLSAVRKSEPEDLKAIRGGYSTKEGCLMRNSIGLSGGLQCLVMFDDMMEPSRIQLECLVQAGLLTGYDIGGTRGHVPLPLDEAVDLG